MSSLQSQSSAIAEPENESSIRTESLSLHLTQLSGQDLRNRVEHTEEGHVRLATVPAVVHADDTAPAIYSEICILRKIKETLSCSSRK